MKRGRNIRWIVIGAIVVLAIGITLFLLLGRKKDTSMEMKKATIPTISFDAQGCEMNLLVGHRREMDVVAMRDSIVVCEKDELKVHISASDA